MDFAKEQILGFPHFVLAVAQGAVPGYASPPGDWRIMDLRKVQMSGFSHFALAFAEGEVLGCLIPRGTGGS